MPPGRRASPPNQGGASRRSCKDIQLFVQATLAYRFPQPAEVLLLIEAARTPSQGVSDEVLLIEPETPLARLDDAHTGERRAVFSAEGEVEIRYSARVDVCGAATDLSGAHGSAIRDLPPDALSYLLPSRYCPSDRLEAFVEEHFRAETAGDRVLAILKWLRTHLTYTTGASDARTTALHTLEARTGVCRDFSHLAISFCRAANIPARAVSAYAWKLEPPDMHAIAEVFVGGRWRLIDPTGLAPTESLVRVATGRDAGDIAFMTVFGEAQLIAQTFATTKL